MSYLNIIKTLKFLITLFNTLKYLDIMGKVKVRHFQYTGLDDFDKSLDEQMNDFIEEKKIVPEQIISVDYAAHSSNNVNTYSALMVYKES